ncbi:MAG: hypothetical protein ACOC3V_05685 [bacterium]
MKNQWIYINTGTLYNLESLHYIFKEYRYYWAYGEIESYKEFGREKYDINFNFLIVRTGTDEKVLTRRDVSMKLYNLDVIEKGDYRRLIKNVLSG